MSDDEELGRRLRKIEQNRFLSSALNGGYPRLPAVDTLPTADERFANQVVVLKGEDFGGGAPVADVAYCCLRNTSGAWGWRQVATG